MDISLPDLPPEFNEFIEPYLKGQISSGIGYNVMADYRDNSVSPKKGIYFKSTGTFYDEKLASKFNFNKFGSNLQGFISIKDKFFIGLNALYQYATKSTPFYFRPYVNLRGIPAMRYQGNNVMAFDTEYRYNFYNRWSMVGFVGFGNAFNNFENMQLAKTHISGGMGVRYLISRLLNMQVGADVARGPESWGVYFVFGYFWSFAL